MTEKTWDERYHELGNPAGEPSLFLRENINALSRGQALDLAMGNGRNTLFLALHGYAVDAIDSSREAADRLRSFVKKKSLPVQVIEADLSSHELEENRYDLIINFYFLERSLFPRIKRALKKGGMLLFETYTTGQVRYGRPHNPDYLLQPNELIRSFSDLHIIFYHERVVASPEETKALASLLAEKI